MTRHQLMQLSLNDIHRIVQQAEDFAAIVKRAKARGGKYGTAERLVSEAQAFTDTVGAMQAKARAAELTKARTP
jgi:hypothetical protein